MRGALGILTTSTDQLDRYLHRLQELTPLSHPGINVHRAPRANLALAVVHAERGTPVVELSTEGDGSFALVCGELYNAGELAPALTEGPGAPGRMAAEGHAAAEILRLYRASSGGGLSAINGAASVAVWDAPTGTLWLFRDRNGVPPWFYVQQGDAFLWSSEIKTLLPLGVPRELDRDALDFFLGFGYVPAPWTLLQAVRKVPAAHLLRVRDGSVRVERYWRPCWQPKMSLTAEERTERLGFLVRQAVRRRVTSSRLGILLSGGVDSALLVACAATDPKIAASVETFTFRYRDYDGADNETAQARQIADHFRVPHHEMEVGPSDVAADLERMIAAYEEPCTYGLHSAWLGPVAERGFDVLLTGSGTGVLGELRPEIHRAAEWGRLPRFARLAARLALPMAKRVRPALASAGASLTLATMPMAATYLSAPVMSERLREELYGRHYVGRSSPAAIRLVQDALEPVRRESFRDQWVHLTMQFVDAEHMLWWHHRWATLHGLSTRHPYVDKDVVEFMLRNERRYSDKDDLRRLAATLMPGEMAYRPKFYQTIPLCEWFRGPLHDLLRSRLTAARIQRDAVFSPTCVGRLIEEHSTGHADHTWALCALLTFVVWQDLLQRDLRWPAGA